MNEQDIAERLDEEGRKIFERAHDARFLRDLLDNIHDGLYFVTRDRRIVYWNKGAERITGFRAEEVVGRSCADNILSHTDDEGSLLCFDRCPLVASMESGAPQSHHVFCLDRNGSRLPVHVRSAPIHDEKGERIGAVEIFSEDAEHRELAERVESLGRAAMTDPLTGLPNRRAFCEALNLAAYAFERYGHPFALAIADLDHFKSVNDRHGHQAGDRVLRVVSQSLASTMRRDDVVARWGGEEFAIILREALDPGGLRVALERARHMVESSRIDVGAGAPHVQTLTFGATIARRGEDFERLIERADALLYAGKKAGRNRVEIG